MISTSIFKSEWVYILPQNYNKIYNKIPLRLSLFKQRILRYTDKKVHFFKSTESVLLELFW